MNAIPVDWDGVANLFVPDEDGGKKRDRGDDEEHVRDRPSRRESNRDRGGNHE
jgi:hypothetical protein